jgi:hypothetical protein
MSRNNSMRFASLSYISTNTVRNEKLPSETLWGSDNRTDQSLGREENAVKRELSVSLGETGSTALVKVVLPEHFYHLRTRGDAFGEIFVGFRL